MAFVLAIVLAFTMLVGCGGGGGESNADIRDCDVDNSGQPVEEAEDEEGTDEKELTVICGDGQVGDNSQTTTTGAE